MTYKVIQWATGSIGKTCLRNVIEHPDLELVGLFAYSDSKVGKDAGEIARRPHTGVKATNSVEEILALDADVVLHLPLNPADSLDEHDEIIRRLLRSGKNVITTIAHTFPPALGVEYAKSFEDAGKEGNATLFGTGINPGTITERIMLAMSSICTHIDQIKVTEIYDCSPVRSPGFIFDLMGVGRPAESFREVKGVQRVFQHIFGEVVGFVGHAMKIDFDEVITDHEFGITKTELELPVGTVPANGVVNFRWRWHGMKDGKPFLTIEMLWIVDPTMPGWEEKDGWNIQISGIPGIKARIELDEPEGLRDRSRAIQYAVAGPVIRAIPEVIKAPPGILLPTIFAPYTPRM
ncbi:MAG: hypothetical protein SH820_14255 [Xanthomonadales bacterium]|nr:hypothetical protein [Xanthomonadales bacterium]